MIISKPKPYFSPPYRSLFRTVAGDALSLESNFFRIFSPLPYGWDCFNTWTHSYANVDRLDTIIMYLKKGNKQIIGLIIVKSIF